jgi:hypothetical protein
MKPNRELIVEAAVVVMVAAVAAVATAADVIATTIVTNANHVGNLVGAAPRGRPRLTSRVIRRDAPDWSPLGLRKLRARKSMPGLRRDLQGQPITPPDHLKHVFLPRFHLPKGIGVVVYILDFTITDLHDAVAGLESAFGSG